MFFANTFYMLFICLGKANKCLKNPYIHGIICLDMEEMVYNIDRGAEFGTEYNKHGEQYESD